MSESSHPQSNLELLRHANLTLRRQLEVAETLTSLVNDQLRQFTSLDFLAGVPIVGEIIWQRACCQPHATDSAVVYQAAILLPPGIGAIAWERDQFLSLENPSDPNWEEARPRFTSFAELEPRLKAMILPHIDPLLDRFLNQVGLKCGRAPAELWDSSGPRRSWVESVQQ